MANYDTPGLTFDSGVRYDEVVTAPANQGKHMAKIKLGLFRLNVEQKLTLGGNIKTAMTDNANFPSPNPALPAYGLLITTLGEKHAAVVALQSQIKTAMTERDVAELAFDAGTTQLASYVDNIAQGRVAVIESAGMGVKANAVPVGPLPQVQNLAITAGDSEGQVELQWDPVHGAKGYEIQISSDPNVATGWQLVASCSGSRWSLEGLTSGQKVWLRVRAKAPKKANFGAWSDPATKIVP